MQLPKEIEDAIKKEAKEKGIDEEVLLIDKLSKDLDPQTRYSLYKEKAEELLAEARKYLESKDFIQASEKAWGACASIVKAYAEKRGLEHYRHRQLEEIMSNIISQMNGDKELISEWSTCLRLHSNFYDNFMTEKDLHSSIELVENFVKNMERILTSNEG
ncbi:PaREP1 family protein [Acidianus ambivalens]|uniref:HEPN domain-containing protein n=1 Tax=Acidianus ambivalens TaxID=2283 RepID=A0A650CTP2_ACIAM|nr:PaREP1 family protein [Acidianus ambivalens]MQL56303.1 HEPN domain-containing protein [Acidianus ambivalens]QGR21163.1 HEPN domain-containing protein [Acidianus ambivalens]